MQDTVSKNTGNSRSLKTVPNALTLYPTYESMLAAMVDGTFPIDIGPLNPAGLLQKGDDLNKSTLLADTLCTALGLPTTATPTQAMEKLRHLVAAAQNTGDSKSRIIAGTYTGNGEASQTIVTGGTPIAVFVIKGDGQLNNLVGYTGAAYGGLAITNYPAIWGDNLPIVSITTGGFVVYSSSVERFQVSANASRYIFHYIAVI